MSTILAHDQIATLWVQFGGRKGAADMAAAIAQAESGGNVEASNPNSDGSIDRGLFQINSSHGAMSRFDVDTNIKAAIALSADGVNWHPWCTAYSDNACGTKGGTYLGSGAAYHQYLTGKYTPADIKFAIASDGSKVLVDGAGQNIVNMQETSQGKDPGEADPQGITGGAATGAAKAVAGWTTSLGSLLGNVLDPKFWLRIGQGLAAAALLLIGLGLMFRKDATAVIGKVPMPV